MKIRNNKKRGISIIGILFLGLIIILVLSYFNISLRAVVESPEAQDNIHYVGGAGRSLWDNYIKEPISYFWNDIWVPLFWRPFISNIKRLLNHQPTDFEIYAPTINNLIRY